MEFSVSSFANRLFDYILESQYFPYMKDNDLDSQKHSKREPLHLKRAIQNQRAIVGDDKTQTFDIGSEALELSHPYYHILQQAPVIRKKGRATEKTKGSQEKLEPQKRDYERVSWNGKTFTKEYSRNVRGERKSKTASYWNETHTKFMNDNANSYVNIHYKYIDKVLDQDVVERLALEFGLKKPQKRISTLAEEYALQENTSIVDILNSHNIGD